MSIHHSTLIILMSLSPAMPATVAQDTVPCTLGLLVHELERITGEETYREIMEDPDGQAFLAAISTNEDWLRELLDSGPVHNGNIVLPFLRDLWTADPELASRPVDRSMATACALALGMNKRDTDWMMSRYVYFRETWNEGLLNACYKDLQTWERRFLARGAQYPSYTANTSLEYLRERICWPRARYVKACWQAPYRGNNCFGDSVQGWLYYDPFRGSFRCDTEMAITVGGVCGALSNTGASAAIANGIPALTMGEPGHCAYAVQTAPGIWTPAYSLSWKRSLHASLYRSTWPSLILSQECLGQASLVQQSGDRRRLAHWYEDRDRIPQAEKMLKDACRIQPLDENLWKEYLQFGVRHDRPQRWWQRAQAAIQVALLPDHPEPAWTLLHAHVYPHLHDPDVPRAIRATARSFCRHLEGWGPSRWNIEGAWAWFHARVGDDAQQQYLHTMLRDLVDSEALGPTFVAWADGIIGDEEEARSAFEQELIGRTRHASAGADAVLRRHARQRLPVTAAAHDLDGFQSVGRAASRLYTPRATLKDAGIEPFPGTLLSSGGALQIFEPGNRWDAPEQHWGVLEEQGGNFHTQVGKLPWFEVELGHAGQIEGLVLEGRRGQTGRSNGVRVLVSDDGEAWTQVATLEGSHIWYRIDLSGTRPHARHVRFERDGQCMHFPRVLIYGRKTG